MKRVECFQADNGQLEKDLGRAKAHDLQCALPRSQANSNATVLDWSQCLRIIENADIVFEHLREYIDLRDRAAEEKAKKEAHDAR